MSLIAWKAAMAYLLDLVVGDPRWLPHPVVGMGKLIVWVERLVRPLYQWLVRRGIAPVLAGRLLGLAFPVIVVGVSFAVPAIVLHLFAQAHPLAASITEVALIATTIATKGLAEAGREIYRALIRRDLTEARRRLSFVVGRDTERLDEAEITRGAVETVAENIVDAVTAPVFFALLGGAPLAFAYRAVNTLDSMIGYKNERYRDLGWASARLDDACNWLPARLTFFALVAAAWLLRFDALHAWRIGWRDARKHPSPNSGWTESAVAGALHVQLGGTNYYRGVASRRARMGDSDIPLQCGHIRDAIRLLYATTCLFVVAGVLVAWWGTG